MHSCRELLPGLTGLWLGVALLKFGNPVILDSLIETPQNVPALLLQPWPVHWGYAFLVVLYLAAIPLWRWPNGVPKLLAALPLIWFVWQTISAIQTVDRTLTGATLPHFFACIAAFYLGLCALSRMSNLSLLWVGFAGAWIIVMVLGWKQHFGGLRELREYFYSLPNWQSQPPELIAKIQSERIYSTLVYPNALAGVILTFSPAVLAATYRSLEGRAAWLKWSAVGALLVSAVGCLIWSGSKAGWIIALGLSTWVIGLCPLSRRRKVPLLLILIILATAAFWYRHAGYFKKGATSVVARADYWSAALSAFWDRPVLGTGPGSFMSVYRKSKAPDSEMTRLVHNDFLQQASDSGLPGFLAYTGFILGSIWVLYRKSQFGSPNFWVVIGLSAGAIHSCLEFNLYIPALAWGTFLGLGTLLGRVCLTKSVDMPPRPHYGSRPRL